MQPEGLCKRKVLVATLRTEPATFRLVAQYLNQLRHRPINLIWKTYTETKFGRAMWKLPMRSEAKANKTEMRELLQVVVLRML
jgi:hypothetical protein